MTKTIKRLINVTCLIDAINGELYMDESTKAAFRSIVYQQPLIDDAPVVHGRWEKCWQEKSKHYFRCSNCHTAFIDGISGAIAPEYGSRAWRFCPNCGAKMDGGVCDG